MSNAKEFYKKWYDITDEDSGASKEEREVIFEMMDAYKEQAAEQLLVCSNCGRPARKGEIEISGRTLCCGGEPVPVTIEYIEDLQNKILHFRDGIKKVLEESEIEVYPNSVAYTSESQLVGAISLIAAL